MTLPGRQERQPRWAGLAWALWVLTLLGLAATAWLDALLRQAGQPALAWLGAGNAASAGAAVVAATVGRWWPAAGPATRSVGCWWPWGCRCP
jgi:hypothetical protein